MNSPTKIMLMACGSFSPPTPMHLRMFEIARDHFNEMGTHQVLGGIVSPVHDSYGKRGLVLGKHRCAMVKLALQSSNWIRLSDWECTKQDKWTRTRYSLQYHQNYINSYINDINGTVNEMIPGWIPKGIKQVQENVQLKLICGADLLESFAVPGLWEDEDIEAILGQHGLVVISRSGNNPEKFIFESDLLTKHKKNITIITNWVANEVSSTMARRLLGRNCSVKYLLDDFVIEYIKKNGLFGVNDTKYILTPNQNQMSLITTANLQNINDNYVQKLNITNYRYDDMDETDFSSKKSLFVNSSRNGGSADCSTLNNGNKTTADDHQQPLPMRQKIFCCGDPLNVKSLLNRPGQAVQIVSGTSGTHTIEYEDEVGETNNISTIKLTPGLSKSLEKKFEFLSDNHLDKIGVGSATCFETLSDEGGGGGTAGVVGIMPSTSARTQNDLIKFVFTSHGIRVISDKEYVV